MNQRAKTLLPIVVIGIGLIAAIAIVKARPKVEKQPVEAVPPLVRVITAQPQTVRLQIVSQGTVEPRTETTLSAQVPGQVRSVASRFAAGAFFKRGEVLLTIDPRDAQTAVEQAEAQLAQAAVQLEREEAEAALAVEEWNDLGIDSEPSSLTLRTPQVAQARAVLSASQAGLERAQLDLERTTIRAPFNGLLRSKKADVGQYVSPGTPLAEMYATDLAEIRLPISNDELVYLDLDLSPDGTQPNLDVELWAEVGNQRRAWSAQIVRTGGEIDSRTRMLDLFAQIERPLEQPGGPLPVGLFVGATIVGSEVENVVVVPRTALRGSDQLLVIDDQNRMYFRKVDVLRTQPQDVILSSGVEAGELICISPIDTVVDGMTVRTVAADTVASQSTREVAP